jgi:hypothetical protein
VGPSRGYGRPNLGKKSFQLFSLLIIV